MRVNYIPKDGGNRVAGTFVFGFGNGSMQSDNFSEELRATGLGTPNALKRSYDYNPGIGGPILRDRLWFHVAYKQTLRPIRPGCLRISTPTTRMRGRMFPSSRAGHSTR